MDGLYCSVVGHNSQINGICMNTKCPANQRIICLECLATIHAECQFKYSTQNQFIDKLKSKKESLLLSELTAIRPLKQTRDSLFKQLAKLSQIVDENIIKQENYIKSQLSIIDQILSSTLNKELWMEGYKQLITSYSLPSIDQEILRVQIDQIKRLTDQMSKLHKRIIPDINHAPTPDIISQYSGEKQYLEIMIFGPQNSGKSSMILKWSDDEFCEHTAPWVMGTTKIFFVNQQHISYSISDSQECLQEFELSRFMYYSHSIAMVLTFDLSQRNSFLELTEARYELTKRYRGVVILVGNKSDLQQQRQVSYQEGEEFSLKYGMQYFETSAKTGENIEQVFTYLALMTFKRLLYGNLQADLLRVRNAPESTQLGQVPKQTKKQGNCHQM